jgi:hypothetical protein
MLDTAEMLDNFVLHLFESCVIVGPAGKITTFTVLLDPHVPELLVPADVLPQAEAKTYLALIE